MLRDALTYPARGDEGTLLVGVALALAVGLLARLGVFAPLAAIPAVLLAGHATAVLRASIEGGEAADAPPGFADPRALAADGLRALAVAVGYLLAPGVALAVTVGGRLAGESPASAGSALVVYAGGTVVLLASLSFAYLLPAALVGVARRRTVRAGLDPAGVRRIATDAGYFVGWVSALGVAAVAAALASAAATAGRPGEVAGLVVAAYALVAVARLIGRSVAR
ncbi:DUF4013 domain-containing protein [Halorussus salilacus]|uniref:DUF4013 domain-containing protein n=1 Tax=Halorussus salilacus TaxID=2953750 RepID=UPI0020A1F839|nr:DUF4013 domain-containing protein [Halorussus salilacus]USZ67842.1 DUF4013 domain-containing protein [Halorussus salilacus]